MNARKRLLRAITGAKVDRPPIVSILTSVTLDMMKNTGKSWPDSHFDSVAMADLAAQGYEMFGFECVKVPFDMTVEAGALDAGIDYGDAVTLPQVREHLKLGPIDVPPNFLTLGRIPTVLQAVSELRNRYVQQVAVVCSVVGPFSLASMLFGFSDFFTATVDNPGRCKDVLRSLTCICIEYAQALIAAGADLIQIGEAAASGELISPGTYRDLVAPCHRVIAHSLSVPVVLHICGNISNHLEHIVATNVDALSFDEKTDLTSAIAVLNGNVSTVGTLATSLLLKGTPGDVAEATNEILAKGIDVLCPGCALPPATPAENLHAFVRVARSFYS